ncbi:MAG TPA: transcription antitermination factor NusB [Planctomycetaceae bacterium]|nr:transcription antitermination factor NusB [Planctomycetaceae bacterium]HRA86851.1 transcription antitermination factor NusB [Planctomycetaceae bacterium]
MAGRSDARRFVLQMLYLVDQNPDADLDRVQIELRKEFTDPPLREFAWSLLSGVIAARAELDEVICRTATNWRLDRMAPTDRNVLRLGLYEMTKLGTPAAVVIDEAIEIAREFGTEHSSSFVNGILDKLIPVAATPEIAS